MRQIEKEMVAAVRERRNWRKANTEVCRGEGVTRVYLHGNAIATFYDDGTRYFSLSGWNTVTTRSRLNALGARVGQRNWEPYYEGVRIDIYGTYTF